jgi:uncharacterized protein (DUF302 family)
VDELGAELRRRRPPRDPARPGASTDASAGFEQNDPSCPARKTARRRQAGRSSADYDGIGIHAYKYTNMLKQSRYSYPDTIDRLTKAISGAGNTIFATIDQAKAAQDAGLTLRPTSLIVFGNPKGGTLLMQAFPRFALELPLKMLVWEDDGSVKIAYAKMSELAARYGLSGEDALIAAMERALDSLSDAVV